MSTQHIESDTERAAREAATNEGSGTVSMVDPNGHLVDLRIGSPLKSGFRYATAVDRQAAKAHAAALDAADRHANEDLVG